MKTHKLGDGPSNIEACHPTLIRRPNMYDIDVGKCDLSVLKRYLAQLKTRKALEARKKALRAMKRQLATIFAARPAILPNP